MSTAFHPTHILSIPGATPIAAELVPQDGTQTRHKLFLSVDDFDDSPPYTLGADGVVRDSNGAPVVGATVARLPQGRPNSARLETAEEAAYRVRSVEAFAL